MCDRDLNTQQLHLEATHDEFVEDGGWTYARIILFYMSEPSKLSTSENDLVI